jgi:protein-L-isoaspartate(D-aspartate) O-methyltransferase
MSSSAILVAVAALVVLACRQSASGPNEEEPDPYATARKEMVRTQLARRDITDLRVLQVMEKVPRHRFIPRAGWGEAYEDHPVRIGYGQTISQPYIVASMTQAVEPDPADRVLEIGTGSGYQAAVLAELVKEVYTIEIVEALGKRAGETLAEMGYKNIHVRVGDGYAGWPEHAPFDIIMLTAAPPKVPQPLFDQLAEGGILVAPVGIGTQDLMRYRKVEGHIRVEELYPVRFVPMTGRAQDDGE